ncbi:MAG TPA: hypothetical protein VMV20_08455 [Chitinophagaceae bacterium]|nr:hypothetical protein [Chitinophagaceae bacterium]
MNSLLFAAFFLLSLWLVPRSRFVRESGLPLWATRLLLLAKLLAGTGIAWYVMEFVPQSDSYSYFQESMAAFHALVHHPVRYILHIPDYFPRYGLDFGSPLGGAHDFWGFSSHQVILKFMTLLDLFTGGGFLGNVVLFNTLVFFGLTALYRFYREQLNLPPLAGVAAAFAIPSLLIWASTFDKDGLLLTLMGLLLWQFGRVLQNKARPGAWTTILICLVLTGLLRDYILVLLLPALLSWALGRRLRFLPAAGIFAAIYILCALAFFNLGKITPAFDLPLQTARRQAQFKSLQGGSRLPLPALQPSFSGFLRLAPLALDHALLQPDPWQLRKGIYFAVLLENLLLLLLFSLMLIFPDRSRPPPALLFLLFLGVSLLMVIGYTIPFLGAISRYRILALSLLVAAIASRTDWKMVRKKILG